MWALRGLLTYEPEPSLPSSVFDLELRLPFESPLPLPRRPRQPLQVTLIELSPDPSQRATTPLASADLCGAKLGPTYDWVGDGEDFCG